MAAGWIRVLGLFSEERKPLIPAPVLKVLHDGFRRALGEGRCLTWAKDANYTVECLGPEETEKRIRYWNRVYGDVLRALG